jgi:heme/copper-type cytochrome/quinol oxidase subunit 1
MGAVFALFSGWYFWSPKILGQPYNELLAWYKIDDLTRIAFQ